MKPHFIISPTETGYCIQQRFWFWYDFYEPTMYARFYSVELALSHLCNLLSKRYIKRDRIIKTIDDSENVGFCYYDSKESKIINLAP